MTFLSSAIGLSVAIIAGLALSGCTHSQSLLGKKEYRLEKDIKQEAFKKFYYTYSSTAFPPEFQRYLFAVDNGKATFYHEKREGETVFLKEKDITVSGTLELSADEWQTFWDFLKKGTVHKRIESTTSGDAGPWLFLYWDGDKDVNQEFEFTNYSTLRAFETFCIELKKKQMGKQ